MTIWQVEIFANVEDFLPVRRGFVVAETETDAVALVVSKLQDDNRAEFHIVSKKLHSIPTNVVLWDVFY